MRHHILNSKRYRFVSHLPQRWPANFHSRLLLDTTGRSMVCFLSSITRLRTTIYHQGLVRSVGQIVGISARSIDQVRSGQVRSGQVRSAASIAASVGRLGQVRSGQVSCQHCSFGRLVITGILARSVVRSLSSSRHVATCSR